MGAQEIRVRPVEGARHKLAVPSGLREGGLPLHRCLHPYHRVLLELQGRRGGVIELLVQVDALLMLHSRLLQVLPHLQDLLAGVTRVVPVMRQRQAQGEIAGGYQAIPC